MSYLKYKGIKKVNNQKWGGKCFSFKPNTICSKDVPYDFVNMLIAIFPEEFEVVSKQDLEIQQGKINIIDPFVQTVNKEVETKIFDVEADVHKILIEKNKKKIMDKFLKGNKKNEPSTIP